MPIYDFLCTKKTCKHEFSQVCSFSEYDEGFVKVKCPKCGKGKPSKVVSTGIIFANSNDKMNNFEYAAEKNMEKAKIHSHTAKEEAKKRGIVSPYADNLPDNTNNGQRMNFVD